MFITIAGYRSLFPAAMVGDGDAATIICHFLFELGVANELPMVLLDLVLGVAATVVQSKVEAVAMLSLEE